MTEIKYFINGILKEAYFQLLSEVDTFSVYTHLVQTDSYKKVTQESI